MSRIRSPGRKAMAKSLAGRQAEGLFYYMKGAPKAVEEDKQFYALFGEWARHGRKDKVLEARMRARWDEVMAGAKEEATLMPLNRLSRVAARRAHAAR